MNFTISRNEIFGMLAKLKGIPNRASSMAVLSHLHVMTVKDRLFITATDLEVAVRVKNRAEVFDEGAVALPAEPLFRIVQKMPDGDISFEAGANNRVRISSGNARFNLAGLAGEEFPEFPNIVFKERLILPSKTLQDMLEKTLFAVSRNEGMVSLAGVFTVMCGNNGCNTLCMVATDGHRLAKVETTSHTTVPVLQEGVIIPLKGGMELLRMSRETDEDLELQIDKNNIAASLADETLVTRLLSGQFPDYRAVLENIDGVPVVSDRESFGECLERIQVIAKKQSSHASLSLAGSGSMEIKAASHGLGDAEDRVDVQTDLQEISVGFNAGYLLEGFRAMKSKDVHIRLKDSQSPALITGREDQGFMYVVMPMKA